MVLVITNQIGNRHELIFIPDRIFFDFLSKHARRQGLGADKNNPDRNTCYVTLDNGTWLGRPAYPYIVKWIIRFIKEVIPKTGKIQSNNLRWPAIADFMDTNQLRFRNFDRYGNTKNPNGAPSLPVNNGYMSFTFDRVLQPVNNNFDELSSDIQIAFLNGMAKTTIKMLEYYVIINDNQNQRVVNRGLEENEKEKKKIKNTFDIYIAKIQKIEEGKRQYTASILHNQQILDTVRANKTEIDKALADKREKIKLNDLNIRLDKNLKYNDILTIYERILKESEQKLEKYKLENRIKFFAFIIKHLNPGIPGI